MIINLTVRRIFNLLVATSIFFSAVQLMNDIEIFTLALDNLRIPNFVVICIFCLSVGTGIQTGFRLITTMPPQGLFVIAMGYAAWYVLLQLAITIGIEISSCSCTSLHDSILAVDSWERVYYSMGLLLFTCVPFHLNRRNGLLATSVA